MSASAYLASAWTALTVLLTVLPLLLLHLILSTLVLIALRHDSLALDDVFQPADMVERGVEGTAQEPRDEHILTDSTRQANKQTRKQGFTKKERGGEGRGGKREEGRGKKKHPCIP